MKIILKNTMVIRISHHIIETLNLYYHINLCLCRKREVVKKLLQNSLLSHLFSEIFSRSFFNSFLYFRSVRARRTCRGQQFTG